MVVSGCWLSAHHIVAAGYEHSLVARWTLADLGRAVGGGFAAQPELQASSVHQQVVDG